MRSYWLLTVAELSIIHKIGLPHLGKMPLLTALDCMKGEPIPTDYKLYRHENLIVSPHMGWYSVQAAIDLKRKVAEQAVKFAQTGTVDYPVYKN